MKISIVTITCRAMPRLEDMSRTLAGSFDAMIDGRDARDVSLEWIVVDEIDRGPVHYDGIQPIVTTPFPSSARRAADKRPAHNSARAAGLLAASTGDYIVFLNDCSVVTRNWVALVADVARACWGFRCRVWERLDHVIPAHGQLVYKDHHDRLHTVPPTTVAGACWGAPRAAFDQIRGFDLAYDGHAKGHDVDAIARLARVGVKFVSSERAFVLRLTRTCTPTEISTIPEAFDDRPNQRLLNDLGRDAQRIHPVVPAPPYALLAPARDLGARTNPPARAGGAPRRDDTADLLAEIERELDVDAPGYEQLEPAFSVAAYMERICVCGQRRGTHVHEWHSEVGSADVLQVLGGGGCRGFMDAIELELGGNPLENKHLGPLMRERDARDADLNADAHEAQYETGGGDN